MVFFTKESSVYGYVVKASPKLKGENSLICTIDSKQFVKYDKDKNNMKSFLYVQNVKPWNFLLTTVEGVGIALIIWWRKEHYDIKFFLQSSHRILKMVHW